MIPMQLAQIAEVVGGRLGDLRDAVVSVTAPASVDSRSVPQGGLFAAMVGEHVDGHDFAEAAVEAGAAAVLCSAAVPVPCVVVPDVRSALAALAAHVAGRLPALAIGITGSAGKTSVKDLVATILETVGPTVAPVGSQNNELGAPLTVLKADESTRFLVVEMGARAIGDVRALCDLVRPRIGAVLNVGSAHLGEFGSAEAIATAKGELVESLPAEGTAVLNGDDRRVSGMAARTAARVLTWGSVGDVRLVASSLDPTGASVSLEYSGVAATVRTALIGSHVGATVAAAVAVAVAAGVEFAVAVEALNGAAARSPHRMAPLVRTDGVVVLDDTYNANPEAMAAALRTLAGLADDGRMAILGEMAELGPGADALHHEVGRLAAELGIEHLIAVGPVAAAIARGFDAGRRGGEPAVGVPDVAAAAVAASARLRGVRLVLVKASRKAALERVCDALLAESR